MLYHGPTTIFCHGQFAPLITEVSTKLFAQFCKISNAAAARVSPLSQDCRRIKNIPRDKTTQISFYPQHIDLRVKSYTSSHRKVTEADTLCQDFYVISG